MHAPSSLSSCNPTIRQLLGVLLAAVVHVTPTTSDAATTRPNVIVVMTDDQGYGDLSCHGTPLLQPPNLDRLHSESARLVDYHVAPTCSPTRASFLTGHWTNRTGVWHTIAGRSILRHGEVTLPSMLQAAGYRTAMFGKWHLGDNTPNRPNERGFDLAVVHGGGGVGQTPDYWDNAYFDGHYFRNGEPFAASGHCTDVWFDEAEAFVRDAAAGDQPFFAYIATNAPHGPMHSRLEFAEPFVGQPGVRDASTAHFLGMIAHIDQRVGQLRDLLKEQRIADDTIFLFTTDNGTAGGDRIWNANMRGKKGSPYDGGHRVPSFWYWPGGGITAEAAGDVEPIAHACDITPTLLDLCGVSQPEGVTFDGTSLAKLLRGQEIAWPRRVIVTDSQRIKHPKKWRNTAVMTDRWRLVNRTELFDLGADPGQQTNVANENPAVVARLSATYDRWWDDVSATFDDIPTIVVGGSGEPEHLTAHDWYVDDSATPWNQGMIRGLANLRPKGGAYWNVTFAEAGTYRFVLRRYPAEVDAAIAGTVPAGEPVPGVEAYRVKPGKPLAVGDTVRAHVRFEPWETDEPLEATGAETPADDSSSHVELAGVPATSGRLFVDFRSPGHQPQPALYVAVERFDDGSPLERSSATPPASTGVSTLVDEQAAAAELATLPVLEGRPPRTIRDLRDRLGDRMARPKLPMPDGVVVHEGVTFVERKSGPVQLDVYLPAGDGPHPTVMLVHGGGWRKGSRTGERDRALWLAARGIASVAPDYRLGDAHAYPALMHDLQQAIAWVRSDRHDFPLKTDRLVLVGGSAGATMVALHAASHAEPALRDPQLPATLDLSVAGAVAIAGPTDTQGPRATEASRQPDSNYHVLLRGSIDEVPTRYRDFNPTHWASDATPPLLFLDENSSQQSDAMRAKLTSAGVPTAQFTFKTVAHPSWHWQPWFDFTMHRVEEFARTLWK